MRGGHLQKVSGEERVSGGSEPAAREICQADSEHGLVVESEGIARPVPVLVVQGDEEGGSIRAVRRPP
jgi:hypothetical protein